MSLSARLRASSTTALQHVGPTTAAGVAHRRVGREAEPDVGIEPNDFGKPAADGSHPDSAWGHSSSGSSVTVSDADAPFGLFTVTFRARRWVGRGGGGGDWTEPPRPRISSANVAMASSS